MKNEIIPILHRKFAVFRTIEQQSPIVIRKLLSQLLPYEPQTVV